MSCVLFFFFFFIIVTTLVPSLSVALGYGKCSDFLPSIGLLFTQQPTMVPSMCWWMEVHQTIVRCGNCFDFLPPIRELLSIHFPAMVPSLRWWINIVLICFCSSNILPWGVETVLIFWIAIHPFSSHGSLPAVAPAPVAVCRPLRAEPQCW